MSNTVDKRVVQMEFDNADFENGIKQTITSLGELKTALQFNTSATNINSLQNAFNSFSLANIENSVEALSQRFSTMGIVGMTVIQNLTNSAIGLASRLEKITIGQIMTGGKNRAQKVADARFQLEGLFAKYEDGAERVTSAFESASKAVDGTAYGLDAAVSTTSQLATSGVELGNDMDTALRAIAGSAAMANTSFEEMGYVFNQVAAKGRLQGDEIMQFSSRGLNVLGTLADYMHLTTEEVRDMSSKGQISFQQFAEAMNDAFGDQAQRANETLTGALSNVRAALSRIGEIFYSGIIENKEFIQTVNDLRIAINAIKKAMEPLKDPFKNLVSAASRLGSAILGLFSVENGFTGFVDKVATGMEVLTSWINVAAEKVESFKKIINFEGITKEVATTAEALRHLTEDEYNAMLDIFKNGVNGLYGNGQDRIDNLGAKGFSQESMTNIQDYLNILAASNWDLEAATEAYGKTTVETQEKVTTSIKDTTKAVEEQKNEVKASSTAVEMVNKVVMALRTAFQSVAKVAGAVRNAFVRVFDPKGVMKNGLTFLDTIINLIEAFKVTDETALKIENTFAGIFSVIDFLITLFTNLFSVVGGIGGPILRALIDIFLSLTSTFGKVIEKINRFVKENKFLQSISQKLVTLFQNWYGTMQIFWEKFNNLPAVKKIKDAFQDFYDSTASKLMDFFGKAGDKADEMFGKINEGDTSKMDKILGDINTALENLISFATQAKDSFTELKASFDQIKNPVVEVIGYFTGLKDNIQKANKQANYITSGDGIMGVFSNAVDSLSGFSDKISEVFDKIIGKLQSIDYSKAVLVGFGTAITTLLATMSYFAFNAGNMVKSFQNVGGSLTGMFNSISKRINNKEADRAKIIRAVALAIVALAGSLYLLAQCDSEKLQGAAKAMAVVIAVLAAFAITMVSVSKRVKDVTAMKNFFDAVSTIMLALAGSVLVLSIALQLLAGIKWNDIWPGLVALVTTMAALTVSIIALSKFGGVMKTNVGTLIFFAAGVYILVAALDKLADVDVTGIDDQLTALLKIMGTVALVMIAAKNVRIGGGLSILATLSSIWLIEIALKKIMETGVTMDQVKQHMDQFRPIIYVLIGIVGALAILGLTSKNAKSYVPTILGIIALLVAICGALTYLMALSAIPTYEKALMGLQQVILMMIGLIIAIGVANGLMGLLGKGNGGGVGATVVACAVALGMMAVAVAALGMVCTDEQLRRGVIVVGALTMFIIGLAVFSNYTEKANYKPILAFTATIAALVVMIMLMSLIKDKTAVVESLFIMIGLLSALGISMYLMCAEADKIDSMKIFMFILLISMVAGALMLLVRMNAPWETVIASAAAMGLVMLSLGGFLAILATIMNKSISPEKFVDIILLLKYMGLIAVAVGAAIALMMIFDRSPGQMIAAAGALALVLASVAVAVGVLDHFDVGSGAANGVLIACAGLILIAAALSALLLANGENDWTAMYAAAGVMILVLGAVSVALGLLTNFADAGGGLVMLAIAGSIAIVLALLTAALISFGKVVPILIDAMKELTKIDYEKIDISKLLQLQIVIAAFGIAAMVASTGIFSLGIAILTLTASVALIITAIGKAASGLAKLVLAIAKLIDSVAKIIELAGTSKIVIKEAVEAALVGLANGLVKASAVIAQNMPQLLLNVSLICDGIVALAYKLELTLIELLLSGIVALTQKLAEKTPTIVENINLVIFAILQGIASMSGMFGYYGAVIAIDFLNGMILGLGSRFEDCVATMIALGIDMVEGLANGLYDSEDRMAGAAGHLANVLAYTFMNVLDSFFHGAFSKLIPAYEEGMNDLKKAIEDYQDENDTSASQQRMQLIKENAEKEKEAFTKTSDEKWTYQKSVEAANAKDAANNTTSTFSGTLSSGLSDVKSQVGSELSNIIDVDQLKGIATEGGSAFGLNFGDSATKEIQSIPVEQVTDQYKDNLIADGWKLNDVGDAYVKEISKPLTDSDAETDEAAGSFTDKLFGSLTSNDNLSRLFSGGEEEKDSIFEGLNNITDSDISTSFDKYKSAMEEGPMAGMAAGAEVNSPSKKAMEIASYIMQGLVVNMDSMITTVKSAYTRLGESSVDALGESMSTVTDIIAAANLEDYSPTITPVVDTSQATSALNTLGRQFDSTSFKMAANTSLSVNESSQVTLASQVQALSDQVQRLADTDYSKLLDGVSVNVDARTTVDGKELRTTSAKYSAQKVNDDQRAYIMAIGGRI